MPNFEQPQQSNTPPDVDELLEKARAKEQARKSVDVGQKKQTPKLQKPFLQKLRQVWRNYSLS